MGYFFRQRVSWVPRTVYFTWKLVTIVVHIHSPILIFISLFLRAMISLWREEFNLDAQSYASGFSRFAFFRQRSKLNSLWTYIVTGFHWKYTLLIVSMYTKQCKNLKLKEKNGFYSGTFIALYTPSRLQKGCPLIFVSPICPLGSNMNINVQNCASLQLAILTLKCFFPDLMFTVAQPLPEAVSW